MTTRGSQQVHHIDSAVQTRVNKMIPMGVCNNHEVEEHLATSTFLHFTDKKIKRRKVEHSLSADETTPKSGRQQHFPLSERQQLALVMQQTLSGSAKSPTHPQTPSSGGKTRGKQPKIYRRNDKGESLLHVASKRGDKRSAKSLIRQGADVNAVDYAGKNVATFVVLYLFFF